MSDSNSPSSACPVGEPKALIFDLFGTLVHFDASGLPKRQVGDSSRPTTVRDPESLLARLSPAPSLDVFFAKIDEVSHELEKEKLDDNREVTSIQRFLRVFSGLGVEGPVDEVAAEFVRRHMTGLSSCIRCPEDRLDLLQGLRGRYRTGLLSNFDHGPTGHALLRQFGLSDHFDAILISDDAGIRKPAPELFSLMLDRLAVGPEDCWHIGDSWRADIRGAQSAGLQPVWIESGERGEGAGDVLVLGDVRELPELLAACEPRI